MAVTGVILKEAEELGRVKAEVLNPFVFVTCCVS